MQIRMNKYRWRVELADLGPERYTSDKPNTITLNQTLSREQKFDAIWCAVLRISDAGAERTLSAESFHVENIRLFNAITIRTVLDQNPHMRSLEDFMATLLADTIAQEPTLLLHDDASDKAPEYLSIPDPNKTLDAKR